MSKIINFKNGRLRVIKIPETVVFNDNNVEDVDGKEIILNYPYDLSKGNLQQTNRYIFFCYRKNKYLLFDMEQKNEYFIDLSDSLYDNETLLKFKPILNTNVDVTFEYMNRSLFIERLENDIVGVFDPIAKIHITCSYGNSLAFSKGEKNREYIYEINVDGNIVSVYYKSDIAGWYNKISTRRVDSYIERFVFNDVEYFVEKTISCEEEAPIKAIYKPYSDLVMLASSNSSLYLKVDSGNLFICEINVISQVLNIYDVLHECFVRKTAFNSYFVFRFFKDNLFFFETDNEFDYSIYYSVTGRQERVSTGNIISFSEKKNGIESKEIDQKGKIVRKHFFEY